MTEIEKAKETLRNAGYFVDNLWTEDDIDAKFKNLTIEEKQDLLYRTLTNEWIMQEIWESMCQIGIDMGYKMIEDED